MSQNSARLPGNKPHLSERPGAKKAIHPQALEVEQSGFTGQIRRLQKLAGNRAIQRMIQRAPSASAITNNTAPYELDDETAVQIEQARTGGQPLDATARTGLESSLGYDLSTVKIHNSPQDSQISQSVGAKAFTLGQDIFFKEGAYNPNSTDGQQLLAHELTHVVQQNNGTVSGSSKMSVNSPNDVHEQQAEQTAQAFTDQQIKQTQANTQNANQLQRKEEDISL